MSYGAPGKQLIGDVLTREISCRFVMAEAGGGIQSEVTFCFIAGLLGLERHIHISIFVIFILEKCSMFMHHVD